MRHLMTLLRDCRGASAAEYALILAVVGVGIIAASIALGGAVSQAMTEAAASMGD